jgi:O-antigen/teichoic acid export membrane protein
MIRQLFKRSTTFFLGSLVSQIISTLTWIFLARIFHPTVIGEIILFINLVLTATFLADFGLNQWYQKKVGTGHGRREVFQKAVAARVATLSISFSVLLLFLVYYKLFSPHISLLLLLVLIFEAFLSVSEGYYLELKKGHFVALKTTSLSLLFITFFFILRRLGFSSDTQLFFSYTIAKLMTLLWFFSVERNGSFSMGLL